VQLALDTVSVARWQFGITTVYHFLFVPLTISLAFLTAGLQTAWVRSGKEHYLKAANFWGKLFLINIAMGVATGLVQEFQFGMNWSAYSRFVGDVFGAPLAFEALIAFFFESTFIGLWIFGKDRLPKKLHAATIWIVAFGTVLSAYFILAANAWMQHPVGYKIVEKADGSKRAQLTDIAAVLFQETAVVNFFHVISSAFLVGAAFMVGIACYHLIRKRHLKVMRTSLRLGLTTAVVAGLLTVISADSLGKVMYEQQPMKMSAAEALWDSQAPAPFSIFAYGNVAKGHNTVAIEVPGLLSFLAKNDFSAKIPGIKDVNKAEQQKYGPGNYEPNIPTAYWSYRWMIGFGGVSIAFGFVGRWLVRKKFWLAEQHRTTDDEPLKLMLTKERELAPAPSKWFWRIGLITMGFPLIATSWGWIFTETGRQPWVVYGVLKTSAAVSPGVSLAEVITSLVVFTSLYAVLAVVEVKLMVKYAKAGPAELTDSDLNPPTKLGSGSDDDSDRPLAFAY
jgi:cytochrome d ubiquinol oxidase subunit I